MTLESNRLAENFSKTERGTERDYGVLKWYQPLIPPGREVAEGTGVIYIWNDCGRSEILLDLRYGKLFKNKEQIAGL